MGGEALPVWLDVVERERDDPLLLVCMKAPFGWGRTSTGTNMAHQNVMCGVRLGKL